MIQVRSAALLVLCAAFASIAVVAKEKPSSKPGTETRMKAETFKALALRGIGPALMSGRIADLAIHPKDRGTWYVAVGSGGVWKTDNAGTTWTPIFDDQGSYSIGCLAIDPKRPDTIWVGTGENVGGRHVGYGDGIYRSLDAGKTWTRIGLEKPEHMGTILVHPENSDVLYVAAQGPLWSPGGDRGLGLDVSLQHDVDILRFGMVVGWARPRIDVNQIDVHIDVLGAVGFIHQAERLAAIPSHDSYRRVLYAHNLDWHKLTSNGSFRLREQ